MTWAHGLRLASHWPWPVGLPRAPGSEPVDVQVVRDDLGPPLTPLDAPHGWFDFSGGRHLLGWPEVGTFTIHGATRVTVCPAPDATDSLLTHVLLGPVLADLVQSRGHLPLHANCNLLPSGAVALAGASGMGKSTLSAALEREGFPLVADDLTTIEFAHGAPQVPTGARRHKLHPDSAERLGFRAHMLPVVYEGVEKRLAPANMESPPIHHPLRAIFLLARGPELVVERLAPAAALLELTMNWFRVEVQRHALPTADLLARAARVAERVPVYRLTYAHTWDELPRVAQTMVHLIAS